ncbi:MAG: hypothetical protein ACRDWY_14480 [Actinomycetes bacterium]
MPSAGRLAAWGGAVLSGEVSPDEAAVRISGHEDPGHRVVGLRGEGAVTLAYAFGRLRALGATGLRLVLPRPGDATGLPGPPPFNEQAVDRGCAVLAMGAGLGLLPDGRATWLASDIDPDRRTPMSLREAEQHLGRVVRESAALLTGLDVARWDPAAADVLPRRSRPSDLPSSAARSAHNLLDQALRVATIVEVARAGDSAAVSASEVRARDEILRELDEAARRAVEAACSAHD